MIIKTKQNWSVGSIVNIGFCKGLRVVGTLSEVDGKPDMYYLVKGDKYYEFTPHNGLFHIESLPEGMDLQLFQN